eukprot:TRINITY_DN1276_c0_g3_i1.p1 TRINITY_DN1276_c0_g3~~TRINITY_DN1276_c0_g3_i1.p1  ORF type:complete len:443 (-),score=166.40 TRINITY_DN1276_c0_g3_i1:228-1556(-)
MAEAQPQLAAYDLTSRMTPHLDRHMVFPILNFLSEANIYKPADITRAEIEHLLETKMLDFAIEKYEALNEEPPAELGAKRETVLNELNSGRDKVMRLLEILESNDELQRMRGLKSTAAICTAFELDSDVFDALMQYAKMMYESGNYAVSKTLLDHYRTIMSQDPENPVTWRTTAAGWGSLASHILDSGYAEAEDLVAKMDEFIDNSKLTRREVLTQKTWLLHWCLFIIFRGMGSSSTSKALDLLLSEKSMVLMSISSQHLFRYVGASMVLNKRLKHLVKDAVRIINQDSSMYNDPITRFLVSLYVDVDFDEAQRELKECAEVFKADFFLSPFWEDFEENARLLIFEAYCRIHQCINIAMIATKLNMTAQEAELWIVKLIQSAKLDARIDSEKSRVVMMKAQATVHQQVIDRTKDLAFRSTMLLSHLEKREAEKAEMLVDGTR